MNDLLWYRKVIPLVFSCLFIIFFFICQYQFSQCGYWLLYKDYSPAYTYVCEFQNLQSIVRQPLNTLSNLLFMYFAIEIMVFSYHDRFNYKDAPNLIRMNYQYSLFFGLSMFFLFIGSTIYHASMLDVFAKFDMFGVYAILLLPLIITVHKIIAATYFGNKPYFSYSGSFVAILVFLLSLYFVAGNFWQNEAYYVLPILFFALVGLSIYHHYYYVKKYRKDFLIMSLLFMFFALPCYVIDQYYCYELSYFQLHSLWHVLAAFSTYYYYLFLRTEKNLILLDS